MKIYLTIASLAFLLSACASPPKQETFYPVLQSESPVVEVNPYDPENNIGNYENEISDLNRIKNVIYSETD